MSTQRAEPLEAGGDKSRHFLALDGVRGVAALGVMVFHFFQSRRPPDEGLGRTLYNATHLGQLGVDLFFVLSGFLITGILLATKERAGRWKRFYLRRVLRIFPLYYGVLTITAIVAVYRGQWSQYLHTHWWYWTYLQNFRSTFWPAAGMQYATVALMPGHFWSLAVEEHFYFIWPAIVFLAPRRWLATILVSLIGVSIASRALMIASGMDVFSFTLCRLDALSVGALIAVAPKAWTRLALFLRSNVLLSLVALVAFGAVYVAVSGKAMGAVQVLKFSATAVLFGVVIAICVGDERQALLGRAFATKPLRFLGKYSYGLYVYHPFVFERSNALLERLGFGPQPSWSLPVFAVGVVATIGVAWLSWQIIESPFLRLKDRFEYAEPMDSIRVSASERAA